MRRAAKVDANHAAILDAFRAYGCSARSTAQLGHDFPDAIIAIQERTLLIEIKDGRLAPSRRKLSPGQDEFRKTWRGMVFTVLSVDDVPDIIDRVLNGTEVTIKTIR